MDINYNQFTGLPVRVLAKANQMNNVLAVVTPHKGTVFIELKEIEKGFFRRATEVERETGIVIDELKKLEREAKNYLLSNWLEKNLIC